MSTSTSRVSMRPAFAAGVRVSDERLHVELKDGREISVPLGEFSFLVAATPEQRANCEIVDSGTAILWPELDAEVGLAGLLGVPETLLEEAAGFTIHHLETIGRTSSAEHITIRPAVAVSVRFADGRLFVRFADDREIGVPIEEFPRLAQATDAQRDHWRITTLGTAIRWPDIDEDIGIAGLLGVPEDLVEEAAGLMSYDLEPSDA